MRECRDGEELLDDAAEKRDFDEFLRIYCRGLTIAYCCCGGPAGEDGWSPLVDAKLSSTGI